MQSYYQVSKIAASELLKCVELPDIHVHFVNCYTVVNMRTTKKYDFLLKIDKKC